MAATLKEFEDILLGFVSRSLTSLQVGDGPTNLVRVAINNACIFAQRKIDFEWNRDFCYLSCNPAGNVVDSAKLYSDDSSVKIKRIDQCYEETNVGHFSPIKHVSKETLNHHISERLNVGTITPNQETIYHSEKRVVQFGKNIELYPRPTTLPYNIYFDGILFLPPLTADSDTNFLLSHAHDFILYRSIIELNFFLKEDERFSINMTLYNEAMKSIQDWNSRLVSPTDTEVDL